MSERYSRVFALPENLYAVGSPVVIAAGTLLKDNQTGRIVAQLKFRNISNKIIKAVKVKLDLFDTAGNPITESVMYDYLDLSASRDTEFGQKTPVSVAESKARSYTVAVQEVVFADKTTWSAIDTPWESIPRQKTLNAVFSDSELVKQYRIALGSDCAYYPLDEKDIWYCTCGALNHADESCNACHRTMFELQSIDLEQLAKDRDTRLAQEAKRAAEEKAVAEIQKQKNRKILRIVIPVLCAVIAVALLVTTVIIPNGKYNAAAALADSGETVKAMFEFGKLGNFKDARERSFALWDEFAERKILDKGYHSVFALKVDGTVVTSTDKYYVNNVSDWTEIVAISASSSHTVGLKADGTVVAAGRNDSGDCNVSDWTDIVAINTSPGLTVGLKADGTVVAVGDNSYGECNVSDWTEIVAISASGLYTVGLRGDGSVVAVGNNMYGACDVSDWTDIVAISTSNGHTVGLKADGTVVAVGDNSYGECDVSDWTDIVAISASSSHTVGLRGDGSVVAVGDNSYGECDVSDWTDIVAISTSDGHTVGLKADGTVVAVGNNMYGACDVSDWTDVVAIIADIFNTVGLKADGTVIAVGDNDNGQCDIADWTNIKLPN